MLAEARISSIWKKQKLFVALMMIAFGGWFFFDGFIDYPRKNERYKVWKKYHDEGRTEEWQAVAKERGWKPNEWPVYLKKHELSDRPPEIPYPRDKIVGQFAFGTLGVVLGGIILIYWLTQKGRVLKMDEQAVYTPAGTRVPFEAITGLGKKRWDSKGIAVVRYELNGRKGQFIIDDYKFDTEPSRKVLATIEERLLARG